VLGSVLAAVFAPVQLYEGGPMAECAMLQVCSCAASVPVRSLQYRDRNWSRA
jgi:hypothetical protein